MYMAQCCTYVMQLQKKKSNTLLHLKKMKFNISATIRTRREIQFLLYAGFSESRDVHKSVVYCIIMSPL